MTQTTTEPVNFFDAIDECAERLSAITGTEYGIDPRSDMGLVARGYRELRALNRGLAAENAGLKKRVGETKADVPLESIPTRDLLDELVKRHGHE